MEERGRPRVLVVLSQYPQVSETYMQNEIDALRLDYDLRIVSLRAPDVACLRHDPYEQVDRADLDRLLAIVEAFRPQVLHGHWLSMAALVGELSRRSGVPFTIRAHSFDVLWNEGRSPLQRLGLASAAPGYLRDALPHLRSERCLGVLSLPIGRERLLRAGIPKRLIHDAPPAFSFARFHDPAPNGDAVMSGGAALPKKSMVDFLDVAALRPELRFDLYPVGYGTEALIEANRARGGHVRIVPDVQPVDMPQVYKQHRWLVYTASTTLKTTGWPLMIAEAQAAGVGVAMRNVRPDMAEWVGPCGYLYDSVEEAARIVARPFPNEQREQGFALARQRDIGQHRHVLTDLWAPALQ